MFKNTYFGEYLGTAASDHSHKKQKSGNTGRLNRNLYVMLKFYRAAQNTGDDFKKNSAFPEGNKQFCR